MSPDHPPKVYYFWRIKDQRTGRLRKLSWRMTEDDARAWAKSEGVAIEKVKGSEETRQSVGDGWGGYVTKAPGM